MVATEARAEGLPSLAVLPPDRFFSGQPQAAKSKRGKGMVLPISAKTKRTKGRWSQAKGGHGPATRQMGRICRPGWASRSKRLSPVKRLNPCKKVEPRKGAQSSSSGEPEGGCSNFNQRRLDRPRAHRPKARHKPYSVRGHFSLPAPRCATARGSILYQVRSAN